MPYRKQPFINNEIYHIVLRGIDGNLIFKDINDYYRGIFSIYELNNAKPTTIQYRRKIRTHLKQKLDRGPTSIVDERQKLVEILAFCFMPNHIHLLVRQINNEGISKFMAKFGTGYGGYFNRRYGRKGYVFQNRFLAVHIKDDNQLKIIFAYIHANPISLIESQWKEDGIKNPEKAIEFAENYKWSSYPDYISKINFPSVTERNFILELMQKEQGCREFLDYWIKYKGKIKEFADLALE